MLARPSMTLPAGEVWRYEPKLDGFRALVHSDGRRLHIDSRNGKLLDPYFPDLVARLPAALGAPCALDGELVIGGEDGLDFGELQTRLSRGRETGRPLLGATYVAFDILAWGVSLLDRPFSERRALLERHIMTNDALAVTPQTNDREAAHAWLSFDARGVEGVVAKRGDLPYRSGQRQMIKVRRLRSVDCVVGGYVPDASGLPAALVLGLYDTCGVLHHVGNTSALAGALRSEAANRLRRYRGRPSFGDGRMPGYGRWPGQRDLVWLPVAPEVVCEVAGGNIDYGRFRHSLRFLRWRPDRDGWSCRTTQLQQLHV
jgi:ATP-dependent DNA ligase